MGQRRESGQHVPCAPSVLRTANYFGGSACISAKTANAVAASAMKRPLSDVGSLCRLSEEAGHAPLVGSWFCTNHPRARPRFS